MKDITKEHIAARLRAAREQSGLTQGQIAKLLNISRPSISEIEAGRRSVSADELVVFSKAYGVSLSWLTNAQPEITNPALELAARELSKLKQDDLDAVIKLLTTLRKSAQDSHE